MNTEQTVEANCIQQPQHPHKSEPYIYIYQQTKLTFRAHETNLREREREILHEDTDVVERSFSVSKEDKFGLVIKSYE